MYTTERLKMKIKWNKTKRKEQSS